MMLGIVTRRNTPNSYRGPKEGFPSDSSRMDSNVWTEEHEHELGNGLTPSMVFPDTITSSPRNQTMDSTPSTPIMSSMTCVPVNDSDPIASWGTVNMLLSDPSTSTTQTSLHAMSPSRVSFQHLGSSGPSSLPGMSSDWRTIHPHFLEVHDDPQPTPRSSGNSKKSLDSASLNQAIRESFRQHSLDSLRMDSNASTDSYKAAAAKLKQPMPSFMGCFDSLPMNSNTSLTSSLGRYDSLEKVEELLSSIERASSCKQQSSVKYLSGSSVEVKKQSPTSAHHQPRLLKTANHSSNAPSSSTTTKEATAPSQLPRQEHRNTKKRVLKPTNDKPPAKQQKAPIPEEDRVYVEDSEVRKYYVYTGRGGKGNNNPGNKRLRKIVSLTRSTYQNIVEKKTKTGYSLFVVDFIMEQGGRFLIKDENSGRYFYIRDTAKARKRARNSVVQALREHKEYEWKNIDVDEKLLFSELVKWKAENNVV